MGTNANENNAKAASEKLGFAQKVGAGLGAGMLGILLGMSGYDGMLAAQPTSAIVMIRLLFSLIPAALYVLVYFACHLYTLDKIKPEVQRVNAERRAQAAAAAEKESEN